VDPRPEQLTVRFRLPSMVDGRILYGAGETAVLDGAVASQLVSRGIAELVDEPPAEGTLAPATLAYPEPPAHKMVTAADNKQPKEGRRGR
jgi:hypothetical protein